MKRTGSAIWKGGIKSGGGTVSTESGALDTVQYVFSKRFGDEPGTNPEELIGAAHASCFSMALSGALEKRDMTAERIETSVAVTVGPVDGGFEISKAHLTVRATIPGAEPDKFAEAANEAKSGCPVSKALGAIEITMDAALTD